MTVKLSERLHAVAMQLPERCRLADIGSDHALLPAYAVQQGIAVYAIAGELNEGPLQAARRQIEERGLGHFIEARLGDGLSVIEHGEADAVSIAGMGGGTMVAILEQGKEKLAGVRRLVLQPNVGENLVRSWLHRNGWLLVSELILQEDGLYYEVLTAEPVLDADAEERYDRLYAEETEARLLMGPYLLQERPRHWVDKWHAEWRKRRKIMARITDSGSPESAGRLQELAEETRLIEEVLACTHTDRR